jgi:hypothetical protein
VLGIGKGESEESGACRRESLRIRRLHIPVPIRSSLPPPSAGGRPNDDGNGRSGRALVHVVLRRRGVGPDYVPPIGVVLANSRDRYIRGRTRFREDGVEA